MFEIKEFIPGHITNNCWGHNLNNEITMKNIQRLCSVPSATRFAFPSNSLQAIYVDPGNLIVLTHKVF